MKEKQSNWISDRVLFEGVTFTTTDLSSKEKAKISDAISSMGGKIKNDLTSETNVLIVGNIDTPKSKFCLKHRTDVTLLYPDDLLDIYNRFKEKNELKLSIQILDDYPWPIFDSCLFCLSRLRDVDTVCYEKNYITKLIDHFGGKSIASLTPKVTYLITDKREGKRYESALDWNISPIHPKWVIDCCNCQRLLNPSFYDISKITDPALIGIGSYKKSRNIVDYGDPHNNSIFSKVIKENKAKNKLSNDNVGDNKLFAGLIFSCYDFNKSQTEKLYNILRANGAEILEDYDLSITHVLVPSTLTMDKIPENIIRLKKIADSKIINEWFLERCLHYNKLIDDSWSLPPLHLNLNYELKIHITGFQDIEHLHITKLIKNLNLTLSNALTKDCDFLVTNLSSLGLTKLNSPQLFNYKFNDILTSKSSNTTVNSTNLTKKKINSAKKWNIPVVSLAFIWEFSQTGILPSVLDTKWCIFAPRSLRPASNFLEYARSVSGGTFHTQHNANNYSEEKDNDFNNINLNTSLNSSPTKLPVQLPSPRKSSQKNWPKLVGTASESQLKSNDAINIDINVNDNEDDDDNYNFKSTRKLIFDDINGKRNNLIDYEDDFGMDEIPVFKKRRF